MKKEYIDWIDGCGTRFTEHYWIWSSLTKLRFPELQERSGTVNCSVRGLTNHIWLVDPDGEIVDPCASRFPCAIFEDGYYRVPFWLYKED